MIDSRFLHIHVKDYLLMTGISSFKVQLNFTIKASLVTIFSLTTIFSAFSQFNEKLEKDISSLSAKYTLDGIEKENALDLLEEITPNHSTTETRKELIGESWKYSHTVSSAGRKYRQSNAIYLFEFKENKEGIFVEKSGGPKTYYKWEDERSALLEIDRYQNSQREKRTRRDYYGVHFISIDRLVLAKLIKSKNHSGKSAIIFVVYFRK